MPFRTKICKRGSHHELYCASCGITQKDNTPLSHDTWKSSDSPRLLKAYQNALSARFEHGQEGAT
jgi:hypothetical protein